jgi:hypothetical protein
MCLCCRKLVEWFAMIAAVIYSLLTLSYVLCILLLSLSMPIIVRTQLSYDLGLLCFSMFSCLLLYVQALALLTATERLTSVMTLVVTRYLPFPLYEWVKAMRKGARIGLQIGFIVQIQYSMAFRGCYKPRKGQQWQYTPVQSWLVDSMISLNYFQFFNQLFLILMILLTLASHVLILGCQGGCDP